MKIPCDADIEHAIGVLKDGGQECAAEWLRWYARKLKIQAAAKAMGCTVRYYRKHILGNMK
jgi:hypothetical protein